MVNPLLTTLFDLCLVGAALMIGAAMIEEYRASRGPVVRRAARPATATRVVRHNVTAPKDFRGEVARMRARRTTRVRAA